MKAQTKSDRLDKAIEHYNEAIRLKPNFAEAYTYRGVAYQSKGEYDRAIEDHNRAIQLIPHYATAYFQPRQYLSRQRRGLTAQSLTLPKQLR